MQKMKNDSDSRMKWIFLISLNNYHLNIIFIIEKPILYRNFSIQNFVDYTFILIDLFIYHIHAL